MTTKPDPDALADELVQEFYLSSDYDPKAARPADTVKAAIAFALRAHSPEAGRAGEALPDQGLLNSVDYFYQRASERLEMLVEAQFWLTKPDDEGQRKAFADRIAAYREALPKEPLPELLPSFAALTPSAPVSPAREEVERVDIRGIALAAIKQAKSAGESQEMLARWISEDIRAALSALQPQQQERGKSKAQVWNMGRPGYGIQCKRCGTIASADISGDGKIAGNAFEDCPAAPTSSPSFRKSPAMTTTRDAGELVEQVAAAIEAVQGGLGYSYSDFCRDAARAAIPIVSDEIERLRAQLAEAADKIETLSAWADGPNGVRWYIDRLAEANDEIERLRAQLAEARGALEPFANCMEYISEDESDEEWAKFRLLIKDYRRAATVIRTLGGDKR